jgi:hypothetical protein
LWKGYKINLVVGKANYCPSGKIDTHKFSAIKHDTAYDILLIAKKEFCINWITTRLDSFLQGNCEKKKYQLEKWSVVCIPKDHGG